MDAPTYVVGHRHPDTDSVCSAIAYAHFKAAMGVPDVRPAWAGDLNSETRYVLQRFALPVPELLEAGTGRRLILVDHNEVAQAVADIEHATILEVCRARPRISSRPTSRRSTWPVTMWALPRSK